MSQKFECVERHLYRRQYQTASGDFSTLYYAIFVDHKGIRRRFPLGGHLDRARDKLGEYRRKSDAGFDFDKEKREREQAKVKAMTLSEWLDDYLELMKTTPSYPTKTAQCAHLKRLLGHLPLSEVSKVRVMEYKQPSTRSPWRISDSESHGQHRQSGSQLLDCRLEPRGR